MATPQVLRLADYRCPDFTTDLVDLSFDIHQEHTVATSKVTYNRSADGQGKTELVLNAENPNPVGSPDYIRSISVDGRVLVEGTDYTYDKKNKEVRIPVAAATANLHVEIETLLEPQNNSGLSGLFESNGLIITQCEAEGFRRIMPFTDRPDVMALYKVRVEAPQDKFSVLLSNGNQTGSGQLGNGRHWASFEDPFRKPSYLFCTANGNLEPLQDTYTTESGQVVDLRTYVQHGEDPELVRHALNSLKKAMKFDEEIFGLEYDLNNFKTIAVNKFNMGAMENKGLNVFVSSLLKASPASATDATYQYIASIVAHEYFHNWTGNRVTLANWFNISLKEGLTVRRDNMFTAQEVASKDAQRIEFVRGFRQSQMPDDDGPMAHPVLPKEVMSIDNCYSTTIYEKGSEVIRMMGELMGQDRLIEGVKAYIKKYDGQAVTINEFIKSMEDISGMDFSGQFRLWYDQSGRPRIKANGVYDAAAQTYTLTLDQTVPPTKDQPVKQLMLVPVRMGLADAAGKDMPLFLTTDDASTKDSGAPERVLRLSEAQQSFVFKNVASEPAFHSLLRGFSAVADIDPGLSQDQLYKQLLLDTDGFNRWDAGQKLGMAEILRLHDAYEKTGVMPEIDTRFLEAVRQMTLDTATDPIVLAMTMGLPGVDEEEAALGTVNPASVIAVGKHLSNTFKEKLRQDWQTLYARTHDGAPYNLDYASIGKRDLKRVALCYLVEKDKTEGCLLAKDLYFAADNMTDKVIAMGALCNYASPERDSVFDDFYQTFHNDPIVIQKWFAYHAYSKSDDVLDRLTKIAAGGVFDWNTPGHVYSLFSSFAANYEKFHRTDGTGYAFLADATIKLNSINPTTAAHLVGPLCEWEKYNDAHARMMIEQLDRIREVPAMDANVLDKVIRSLPDDGKRAALGLAPLPSRNNAAISPTGIAPGP